MTQLQFSAAMEDDQPLPLELPPSLSVGEESFLAECEIVIERGLGVFIEVGEALTAVRNNRLYRTEFGTFDDYCRDRWGLTKTHANRMVDAARVVELISTPMGVEINSGDDSDVPIPATERQARELTPLLDDPDELREVWNETLERTNGKPTAAAIKNVREEREEAKLSANDVKAAASALGRANRPAQSAEDEQALKQQIARQESLSAWNQAHDGLVHALSYAKTWRPPADTDIYVSVDQFAARAAELAAIAEAWKENHGQD